MTPTMTPKALDRGRRGRWRARWVLPAAMALAWALLANHQAAAQLPGTHVVDRHARVRAELLGILAHTRLTLRFDEVPARDAFKSVSEALDVTIVGRYSDDDRGHGIDPDVPLTIRADNRPARDVLEEMLEQCEVLEDCTWQLRPGFIEVGTKARLAVPAARDTRTYELTDLLLEPPYFPSPSSAEPMLPCDSVYVESILGEKSREAVRRGMPVPRKTPVDIAQELVEGIVETIEPGRWDFGAFAEEDTQEVTQPESAPPGTGTAPAAQGRGRAGPPPQRPWVWATLRVFRKQLIIAAPDFIHRQVGGYPQPLKPPWGERLVVVASPGAAVRDARPAEAPQPKQD